MRALSIRQTASTAATDAGRPGDAGSSGNVNGPSDVGSPGDAIVRGDASPPGETGVGREPGWSDELGERAATSSPASPPRCGAFMAVAGVSDAARGSGACLLFAPAFLLAEELVVFVPGEVAHVGDPAHFELRAWPLQRGA